MRIDSVQLKDGSALEFGNFNVFIGGNAVGKTTLALELWSRATGYTRSRWYWTADGNPTYSSQDVRGDLQLLLGSMARQYEGANLFYYSQAAKNLQGDADLDGKYRFAATEHSQLNDWCEGKTPFPDNIFASQLKYRRSFIAFASCEARLMLPSRVNVTALSQPPQDSVNVLYRRGDLLDEIDEKIRQQFRFHLSLLDHIRTEFELGFSREVGPQFDNTVRDRQAEFTRIEGWKTEHFVPVEEIGHGMRSMVKLLMTLLEPVNQIVFIDEPELHIYPAQKRWLGRQLVLFAKERGKQVFVVTHDPIVLQGILDAPTATRIFRINMDEAEQRTIHRCDLENVVDVGARRNQDSYLQALFYQRCIAVEGASDRAFYQVMTEELFPDRIADKDLGFVACGGKGASKNVAHMAAQVGLRSALIYDFDALLWDIPLTKEICAIRGGKTESLEKLEQVLRDQFGLDSKRVKAEADNAHKLGFASKFVQTHRELFEAAMSDLKSVGILVVPSGSLESWAPEVEEKVRFSEQAPDVIKSNQELRQRLESFLNEVLVSVDA